MAKIEVTLELAELLERLAGYAAYIEESACGRWSYLDDIYVADESKALTLAKQIRGLIERE